MANLWYALNEQNQREYSTCYNGHFDGGHNHHTCHLCYHLLNFYPCSSCDGDLHLFPYTDFYLWSLISHDLIHVNCAESNFTLVSHLTNNRNKRLLSKGYKIWRICVQLEHCHHRFTNDHHHHNKARKLAKILDHEDKLDTNHFPWKIHRSDWFNNLIRHPEENEPFLIALHSKSCVLYFCFRIYLHMRVLYV